MTLFYKTYTLSTWISAPKIPTDFLWALSLLFLVISFVYVASVFFFRNRISRIGKLVMAKRKVFSPMICEFLFYEEGGDKKEKINYIDLKIQIRELIKNRFDREVLTAVLMDLRKDVTGKTRAELFRVYEDLDLHKDAYKKLNSWRWELVSKGIFELTQMEVKDSYSVIMRFINDKRSTIRKQAEIATVSLKEEGINYFLDHTRYKISEWQQLKLLDVVRNKTDYEPPPFRIWLTSKNNHVVLFALRLINYYNQNDANASLIQLLRHRDNQVKKEAIFCIRDFNVIEAVPVLKMIFWKCTTDVKMYILEALSQLGTIEDIGFLEDLITKEVAFTVKGKAISALNTIRPEGVLPTQDIIPKVEFETEVSEPIADISTTKETEIPRKQIEEQAILQDIPMSIESESIDANQEPQPSLGIEPIEISFLPIVTVATTEEAKKLLDSEEMDKKSSLDILSIEVCFNEVSPYSSVADLHYKFLPIVIGTRVPEIKQETKQILNELPVCFEEVIIVEEVLTEENKTEQYSTREISVIHEEVLASLVEETNEVKNSEPESHTTTQESKTVLADGVEVENLFQITVIYDVMTNEKVTTTRKDSIPEIDWSCAFETAIVMQPKEVFSQSTLDSKMEQQLWSIPKPLFYDNTALNTIALLEDIAELGDQREIPYLNNLLEKEVNIKVKARIVELIASFSTVADTSIPANDIDSDKRQSVFYSLLESCDTEAKIILLEEIAEVGDEQEMRLLESLVSSNHGRLQKSAKRALEKLTARIVIKNKNTSNEIPIAREKTNADLSTDIDYLFELDFDMIASGQNKKKIKNSPTATKDGNTLFDRLCAMSGNLYEKQ